MEAAFAGDERRVDHSLERVPSGGWLLILLPDMDWLRDDGRSYPVTIDPTIGFDAVHDCTLDQASPSTSFCWDAGLQVGWDGSNASRAAFLFDTSSIPDGGVVLNAEFEMKLLSATTANAADVKLYPLTRSFTSAATWSSYDGADSWSTAGGDYDSSQDWSAAQGPISNTPLYYDWEPLSLVQGWVDGTIENNGLLLKQDGENVNNVLGFPSSDTSPWNGNPTLYVAYQYRIGVQRQYSFDSHALDDREQLQVNLGNGNLLLSAKDFQLPGTAGFGFGYDRWFNSLSPQNWFVGNRWESTITTMHLRHIYGNSGSADYVGPTGYEVPFANGGWQSDMETPAGMDASMTYDSNVDVYTLEHHESGVTETLPTSASGESAGMTKMTDRNGNTIAFHFGTDRLASITDTKGHTTSFGYDADRYLVSVTDPAGRVYRYGYDASHNLTSYTDPSQHTTAYEYDVNHELVKVTTPAGRVTTLAYDGDADRARPDRRQRRDRLCLSGGRRVLPGRGDGADGRDRPERAPVDVLSRQRCARAEDDRPGRKRELDRLLERHEQLRRREPCSSTDALGKTTLYGYYPGSVVGSNRIAAGENLNWRQSPLEGTTNRPTLYYNDGNNPYGASQNTDPGYVSGGTGAHSWLYSYNATGNLASKSEGDTGAGQNPVSFDYNADGTLKTATDAKGAVTSYSYDASTHDLTEVTPPAPLGAVSLTYYTAAEGHPDLVKTITDGKGQTRTYSYDVLDRVTQIVYAGGPTLTFGYDADGNLTDQSDPTGSYSYRYDDLGRLTQEDQPGPKTISYGYDDASNLTSLTDVSGTTGYGYDSRNLVVSMLEPGAASAVTFVYDANGNRTQVDYPNGVSEQVVYDDAQRISRVYAEKPLGSGNVLTSFGYSYLNGTLDGDLRRSVTAQYPAGSSSTTFYCYDGLGRLTSADTTSSACPNGSARYRYVYDVNGNITSKTVDGATTSYTVNAANQLTSSGYTFDANGSQTASPGVFSSASYNTLGQTSSITAVGGSRITMSYSGLGQSRRTSAGSTSFTYDQLGLNEASGSPNEFYSRDPDGSILGIRCNGNYYLLHDALGSVVAMTDSSGTVVRTFEYDPYGDTTAATGSIHEPIRYAGGYLDSANDPNAPSLYKFGERYYDPTTGRWTQQDPINQALDLHGWNRYIYAGDDPIGHVDVSGESWTPWDSCMLAIAYCTSTKTKKTFVAGCWNAVNPAENVWPLALDVAKGSLLHRLRGKAVLEAARLGAKGVAADFPIVTLLTCGHGGLIAVWTK